MVNSIVSPDTGVLLSVNLTEYVNFLFEYTFIDLAVIFLESVSSNSSTSSELSILSLLLLLVNVVLFDFSFNLSTSSLSVASSV